MENKTIATVAAACIVAALVGGVTASRSAEETGMPVSCSPTAPDVPPLCCNRDKVLGKMVEFPRIINHGDHKGAPRVEDPITSDPPYYGTGPVENYPCGDTFWG